MVSRTHRYGALLLVASCAAGKASPPSAHEVTVPLVTTPLSVAGAIGGRPVVVRLDPGRPLTLAKGACSVQRSASTVRVEEPTTGLAQDLPLGILPSLAVGDFRFPILEVATSSAANQPCEVMLGDDALQGLTLEINFPAAQVTLRRNLGEPLPGNFAPVPLTRNPSFDWPLLALRIVQGATNFVAPALFSLQVPTTTLVGAVSELRTAQEITNQLDSLRIQVDRPSRPDAYPIHFLAILPKVAIGPTFIEARRDQKSAGLKTQGFDAILGLDMWRGKVLLYQAGSGVLLVRTSAELATPTSREAWELLSRLPAERVTIESPPSETVP